MAPVPAFGVVRDGSRQEPAKAPNAGVGAQHPILAVQRAAGNQATCELLRREGQGQHVHRLFFPTAPEYNGDADKMSDFTLNRIWSLHKRGELYVSAVNLKELTRVMKKRKLDVTGDSWKNNPLDLDREHMKTSGAVGVEVAKPAGVVSAGLGGGLGAGTHSSAAGSSVGGEIVGAALLADSAMGMYGAYNAHGAAKARGDTAGMHIAKGRAQTAGWGLAGGAAGAASGGMKVGAAFGSTAVGLAAATGALGIAGGAVTAAQGIWKIVKSGRKLSALSDVKPITEPGRGWKGFISGREQRKVAVNALKVAAGVLGIAAGALLIASNPVGWAIGIAAMVTGGVVTGFKLFQKVKKSWKQRNAKKKAEAEGGMDELAQPVPGGHAAGSPEETEARRKQVRALADKVTAENSEGGRYASEMRGALQAGDEQKGHFGLLMRETFHPRDTDFSETIAAQSVDEERYRFSQADLKAYDASCLLDILNVTREEALSESGQDLIARKMSVSAAS